MIPTELVPSWLTKMWEDRTEVGYYFSFDSADGFGIGYYCSPSAGQDHIQAGGE